MVAMLTAAVAPMASWAVSPITRMAWFALLRLRRLLRLFFFLQGMFNHLLLFTIALNLQELPTFRLLNFIETMFCGFMRLCAFNLFLTSCFLLR